MRIEIACFTDRSHELGLRLERMFREAGDAARLERCGGDVPVRQWAAERFPEADALVFIGAVGIAVRAIASEIVSKTSDPAVVVVDDCGRFAVSLLSGHIGGANALAEKIAGLIGATSVITTATDGSGVFAVDVWAARNGLAIVNPEKIKTVSAKLLAGREVKMRSAFPVSGRLPNGVVLADDDFDLLVDARANAAPDALQLVPPAAVLGVGCRKGVNAGAVENAFLLFCETAGICPQAFGKVCSIDIKAEEKGLVGFSAKRGLVFETFSAAALADVAGDFSASPFVASVTGVDNVCERSAVAGCGGKGRLIAGKTVYGGVTMAAAMADYTIRFEPSDGEAV